ncbi:MAG TPA: hypothetical protein VNJ51_06205 [Candidatus Dormibacteraeota bacterium]|nr:hypothetical protein [Candidatus Dormibacteraeota bacterium]
MRNPILAVVGAGATFAGAVLAGLYLGWLAGSRTGHPALMVAGLFVGMLAGGVLVARMVTRLKF